MDYGAPLVDAWTFKKDTNGRWIWIGYSEDGEALYASRADYDDIHACVEDARARGYRGSVDKEVRDG